MSMTPATKIQLVSATVSVTSTVMRIPLVCSTQATVSVPSNSLTPATKIAL